MKSCKGSPCGWRRASKTKRRERLRFENHPLRGFSVPGPSPRNNKDQLLLQLASIPMLNADSSQVIPTQP